MLKADVELQFSDFCLQRAEISVFYHPGSYLLFFFFFKYKIGFLSITALAVLDVTL